MNALATMDGRLPRCYGSCIVYFPADALRAWQRCRACDAVCRHSRCKSTLPHDNFCDDARSSACQRGHRSRQCIKIFFMQYLIGEKPTLGCAPAMVARPIGPTSSLAGSGGGGAAAFLGGSRRVMFILALTCRALRPVLKAAGGKIYKV